VLSAGVDGEVGVWAPDLGKAGRVDQPTEFKAAALLQAGAGTTGMGTVISLASPEATSRRE